MRIIFFGSSDFAKNSLLALSKASHNIVAVCALPGATAISCLAEEIGLNLIQPQDITANETKARLKELAPDLFVVVSYGRLFDSRTLRIPRLYAINLHASLLPEYRGAAPIQRAIIKGETETGVTIFRINESLDSGDIILQKKSPIAYTDTSITLSERLSEYGASALVETLSLIEKEKVVFIPQDDRDASYAPKLKKSDGLIDWSKFATDIYNQIRGALPWPGAFTFWNGKMIKIYKSEVREQRTEDRRQGSEVRKGCGEILSIDKDGIMVDTGQGRLVIKELQLEGARRMNAFEFTLGRRIKQGDVLCQN